MVKGMGVKKKNEKKKEKKGKKMQFSLPSLVTKSKHATYVAGKTPIA